MSEEWLGLNRSTVTGTIILHSFLQFLGIKVFRRTPPSDRVCPEEIDPTPMAPELLKDIAYFNTFLPHKAQEWWSSFTNGNQFPEDYGMMDAEVCFCRRIDASSNFKH